MANKTNRAIVEPVSVGDKLYKPGMEKELASSGTPQWNVDAMVAKGWLSGDWSNIGLTPEEEAKEAVKAAPK